MTNPWLKRNPAMSLWLSAFNSAANTGRAAAAAQMQRQMQAVMIEGTQQMLRFWTGAAMLPRPSASKARRRRK